MNHYGLPGMPMSPPYLNPNRFLVSNNNFRIYANGTPIPEGDPAHKQAIYNHPLFPLLCQVLKKVEYAATLPRGVPGGLRDDECTNQSVIEDIALAAQQIQRDYPHYKPDPTVSDTSVDSLMIQAIQVLRTHLWEFEKVNEMSVGFCKSLVKKSKDQLQVDVIKHCASLGGDGDGENNSMAYGDGDDLESQHSPATSSMYGGNPTTPMPPSNWAQNSFKSEHSNDSSDSHSYHSGLIKHQHQAAGPSHYSGAYYPQSSASSSVGPSASWGGSNPSPASYSPAPESTNGSLGSEDADIGDEDEGLSSGRKTQKKRGIFPKSATNILRNWLFQHLAHPYPTEDQKRQLALETELTILQVNNWFINARRRIVQPLVDQTNRAGHAGHGLGMYPGNSHSQAYPVDLLPSAHAHSGGYMSMNGQMQMAGPPGAGSSSGYSHNLSNPYGHGHGAHSGYNYGSAAAAAAYAQEQRHNFYDN